MKNVYWLEKHHHIACKKTFWRKPFFNQCLMVCMPFFACHKSRIQRSKQNFTAWNLQILILRQCNNRHWCTSWMFFHNRFSLCTCNYLQTQMKNKSTSLLRARRDNSFWHFFTPFTLSKFYEFYCSIFQHYWHHIIHHLVCLCVWFEKFVVDSWKRIPFSRQQNPTIGYI